MSQELIDKDYIVDLQTIKESIRENRNKTLIVVNSAMILTYHKIGTVINHRKEWGNKYIQRLGVDLKEYGRGFSFDQLRRMARFASIFTEDEIRAQPGPKIPWKTLIEIINKSSSKEEILWFADQTHKNKWSKSKVKEQFKNKVNERNLIEPQVTEIAGKDEQLKDVFIDTLSFGFLGKIEIH